MVTKKTRKIFERWEDYLQEELKRKSLVTDDGLSPLFSSPQCGTCSYWALLNGDSIDEIADDWPLDFRRIEEGYQGKLGDTFEDDNETLDPYFFHQFFGWCKRYPPSSREGYSVLGFSIRHVPRLLSEHGFPIMAHNQWCGEWKKDAWVDEMLSKKSPS